MPKLLQYVLAVLAFAKIKVTQHDIYVIVGTVLNRLIGMGYQLNFVGTAASKHLAHGQPEILEVINNQIGELAERVEVSFGIGHERFCLSSLLTSALSAAGFTGL